MFVSKVVVFCSILINLSLALEECTNETPWYCKGGVNKTSVRELTRNVDRAKRHGKRIRRTLNDEERGNRTHIMCHKNQKIPEFFDARENWPQCKSLGDIYDQLSCQTGTVFSAVMATNDRLCIADKNHQAFDLSEQEIITCCGDCYWHFLAPQCDTATHLTASFWHLLEHGLVDEECQPYNPETFSKDCSETCDDETIPYKKINFSYLVAGAVSDPKPTSSIKDIQIEIMKYGPVSTQLMNLPEDLRKNYSDGVYEDQGADPDTLYEQHGIKILGWGTEDGIPYWLCANTWGVNWGKLGGFFKLKRGFNQLRCEELFMAVDTDPTQRPFLLYQWTITADNARSVKDYYYYYKIAVVVNFYVLYFIM